MVVSIGGIATATIDNPPINLIDLELYLEHAPCRATELDDDDVRVVVLRAATRTSSSPTSTSSSSCSSRPSLARADRAQRVPPRCARRFRTMPKATIAVIDGRVGGGGSELARRCDMRFALGRPS